MATQAFDKIARPSGRTLHKSRTRPIGRIFRGVGKCAADTELLVRGPCVPQRTAQRHSKRTAACRAAAFK
eukprot:12365734-Heterocapsa_arctica.AAC.1